MVKLTTTMKETLLDIFNNNHSKSQNNNTIKSLIKRKLINEKGTITQEGRECAICHLPLKLQAEILNLPIYEAYGEYGSSPEYYLWKLFEKKGFVGSYCEGGAILSLLKAAALPTLEKLNTFRSREDACTRFIEAQFKIHQSKSSEILKTIQNTSLDNIKTHFKEIYSYSTVQKAYPDLSINRISYLFESITPDVLCNIGKLIFEDPYKYRNGWPDLTLVKNKKIWFAEIKTTDKLHMSQIQTIPRIREIIPANLIIIKLVNDKRMQLPDI